MNQKLICILGPTASGKTKFAVKMAYDLGGEIISADSRQVYRGMDIGTGKDIEDYLYNGVHIPYHLIDIVNPGYKYNIFEYQQDFNRVYQEIVGRGVQPILCGGSGLYIESVINGYNLPEVLVDNILREKLESISTQDLIEMLASMRSLHNSTDTTSRKRLIRAIEIAKYMENNDLAQSDFGPVDTVIYGIDIPREERIKRIDERLDKRLDGGMIQEVKLLLESGLSPEDLIYYGLEYKFITLYLVGDLSFEQMREKLAIAIHQFAKRQMTWFRGMEKRGAIINWIDYKKII